MTDLLVLIVATEAVTEAIFRAGPLQRTRSWLIEKTPLLYSEAMSSHLLECKYCTSFWVGVVLFSIYNFGVAKPAFLWFLYAVAVPRLANFLHVPFSWLRDKQLNLRIERGKRSRDG